MPNPWIAVPAPGPKSTICATPRMSARIMTAMADSPFSSFGADATNDVVTRRSGSLNSFVSEYCAATATPMPPRAALLKCPMLAVSTRPAKGSVQSCANEGRAMPAKAPSTRRFAAASSETETEAAPLAPSSSSAAFATTWRAPGRRGGALRAARRLRMAAAAAATTQSAAQPVDETVEQPIEGTSGWYRTAAPPANSIRRLSGAELAETGKDEANAAMA
mmetsp:Transcript_6174/g.15095  ORF Transcript_6174/g.15095 Transcript_6174/m.15095 type:complete len:220 (+) Transcript_6174:1107-1766(+)